MRLAWLGLLACLGGAGCDRILGLGQLPTPSADGATADATSDGSFAACPGYTAVPNAGASTYRVGDNTASHTWTQAEAACAADGGHLVVFDSDAELAAVTALVSGVAFHPVHTGMYRASASLPFATLTKTSYSIPNAAWVASYAAQNDQGPPSSMVWWTVEGVGAGFGMTNASWGEDYICECDHLPVTEPSPGF